MTTTFTYGGTALSSFGRVTLMDEYLDFPVRRGANMTIPYRHGTAFAAKYYDQRTITIGIAVIAASITALETAMDTMRTLFSPRTEQTLTMTMDGGAIRTIQAAVDTPIQFQRVSPLIGRVVVEFTCSRPFWRSNTAIADNTTTINASPKAMSVNNTGSIEESDAKITLTGPLQDVTITNSTSVVTMTYTGTIPAAETVVIQTNAWGEYVATWGVVNVIGSVTHSGAASLMLFVPGNNTLAITSTTPTTGTVKVEFFPPYL